MCCPDLPQSLRAVLPNTPHPDPYFGHGYIALAFTKFLALNPSLRYLNAARVTTTPFSQPIHHEPLDMFIARVVHTCRVPNIVPYAALYILSTLSHPRRTPRPRPRSSSSPFLTRSNSLSHQLFRALSRSRPRTQRRARWSGHTIFLSAFLVALHAYHNPLRNQDIPDLEALSDITSYSVSDLGEIEESIRVMMDTETLNEATDMLQGLSFKFIRQLECAGLGTVGPRKGTGSGWEEGHWRRWLSVWRGSAKEGKLYA